MITEKTIEVKLTPQECKFLYTVCKDYKMMVQAKSLIFGASMAGMTGLEPNAENKGTLITMTETLSKAVISAEQDNLKIAQDLTSTFRCPPPTP